MCPSFLICILIQRKKKKRANFERETKWTWIIFMLLWIPWTPISFKAELFKVEAAHPWGHTYPFLGPWAVLKKSFSRSFHVSSFLKLICLRTVSVFCCPSFPKSQLSFPAFQKKKKKKKCNFHPSWILTWCSFPGIKTSEAQNKGTGWKCIAPEEAKRGDRT